MDYDDDAPRWVRGPECQFHGNMTHSCRQCDAAALAQRDARIAELEKALQHSEGMQGGALKLKRIRDLRLQAIRDAINQGKGDDLVRREVEWLLDCDARELDGFAALAAAKGED